jgi:hypothetical protein
VTCRCLPARALAVMLIDKTASFCASELEGIEDAFIHEPLSIAVSVRGAASSPRLLSHTSWATLMPPSLRDPGG